MRRLLSSWPWNRRQHGARMAHALGVDVERLLLVLFFVVFAIGTVLAIAELWKSHSLY